MEPSPAGNPAIRFRPGKKRKAYRQRDHDDEASAPASTSTLTPSNDQAGGGSAVKLGGSGNGNGDNNSNNVVDDNGVKEDDDERSGVAVALRLRNARRGRLNGVGFRSTVRQDDEETSGDRALILHGAEGALDKDARLSSVANRFTHQTGLVADLNDRHMMEYIESRLSSRASDTKPQPQEVAAPAPASSTSAVPAPPNAPRATKGPNGGQGAMQGHLMEIDLGEEARDLNVARTERATGLSGATEDDGPGGGHQAKKPRLGRDGKPRRPRNRRNSDAIKRDQIVEDILRENRLDVYEAPAAQPPSNAPGGDQDGAADDRLAEEFRQRFLDDVAQRQLRKKKPTAQPTKSDDVLRGPKLGGSRNVRAAMRDLLLKKEKEGKK
ncbi:hypothetical protein BGZ63DRAFT_411548 [Mariannaea sp. PMI_226]|nr:hypothetical protein BGZ63DRAFT_411548 [Mariannaea sp. PMI_226]